MFLIVIFGKGLAAAIVAAIAAGGGMDWPYKHFSQQEFGVGGENVDTAFFHFLDLIRERAGGGAYLRILANENDPYFFWGLRCRGSFQISNA